MSSTTSLIPITEPLVQTASNFQSSLIHFSHTCTIDNFSHRVASSTSRPCFQSSDICFSYEAEQTFELCIYPNGTSEEESNGYLSLFISNSDESYPIVACKFAILDDKGNKCNVQESQKTFCDIEIGFEKFISRNELFEPSNGFLPNNKLTIYVEICYLTDDETTAVSYNQASIGSSSESQLSEDYAKLLASGELSDVVLIVSDTEFRAHKLVLSARSSVFRAMFEHDLLENQQNRVEITDVKAEVFQQLLTYIYSGKCDSIEGNTEELLAAADKYRLITLKIDCEQYLCTKVTVETAPNLLLLADSYNADKLKETVLDFVKRHSKETIEALIDSELLVDMFRSVAKKSEQLEK